MGLHSGFRSEAAFWERELSLKGDFADFVSDSLDPERMSRVFPPDLASITGALQGRFGSGLRALDVGCGPSSLLSLGHIRGWYELTGVDPLAEGYREALLAQGRSPVGVLRQGYAESLSALFEPASFHLIFTCNALDHTQSPGQAVEQMCRALVPGGVLYIQGYVREGSANQFHGLHQHDLYLLSGGRLMCRTRAWPLRRGGRADCISADLPMIAIDQTPPSSEVKSHLRVVYRKRG